MSIVNGRRAVHAEDRAPRPREGDGSAAQGRPPRYLYLAEWLGGSRRPNDSRRLLVAADGAGVPIEAEGEPVAVRAVVTGAAEYGVQGSGVRRAVADGRAQRPVSAENGAPDAWGTAEQAQAAGTEGCPAEPPRSPNPRPVRARWPHRRR
ncbi:hypothetical protein G3I47_24855 [Streptomyces anulatus]|uniref:hypothetical protein n=1 Tax=Streptomyces anulatus TaxID=1892 RepID=UPI0013BD0F49|nr:hypothetical protein [Streptomyces anulatus]NDZ60463.1 hypothetical protein [Streptomyces anulatus]